jgi:hypothetical protein
MSNIERDWLFIDASRSVIKEGEREREREREKKEMVDKNTRIHIYINLFLYFPDV